MNWVCHFRIRLLMDQIFVRGGVWRALEVGGMEDIRQIVVVIVDAQTKIDLQAAKKDTSIPILDTILAASAVPLNHYSFETVALLQSQLKKWEDEIVSERR